MSLRDLPALLRAEPAMVRLMGGGPVTLSVGTQAQAVTLAAMLRLGSRRPVLVVVPTGTAAEHLARDLGTFLAEPVDVFPAWETLPFERISPDVGTMGQRLRALWRLSGGAGHAGQAGGAGPEGGGPILVAPVKAVLQRLGPWQSAARPVTVSVGDRVALDDLVRTLVEAGYRREAQVEHRGELAVRGGIVDVFPSTDDEPVRIDLWGDEVDRVTTFDIGSQRSTGSIGTATVFGCRELVAGEEVRARAAALVGTAPWGRHQWEQLADGTTFDGMESWLPWVTGTEELVTDLLPDGAVVVIVEPRRVRDRATELLEEEAALADSLAATWGADLGERAPRLHLPYERMLAHTGAAVVSVVPPTDVVTAGATGTAGGVGTAGSAGTAGGTGTVASDGTGAVAAIESRGWEPILGDGTRLASQCRTLVDSGYVVVLSAETPIGAERIAAILAEEGMDAPVVGTDDPTLATPGVRVVVAGLERGFVLPTSRLAVLGESDLTGRRRPHRRARTRARPTDGFFDDLAPGGYVVHRQHGVAVYRGMVTRTMGGVTRDYLLLEYRGDDKLYLPTDQIELLTPYAGGDSPTVHRLGGSEWQRARSKARAAVHEIAEDLVALYRRRLEVPGHAFGPDTPWQAELEASFPFVETADQLQAIADVKADMERPVPMDRLVCGDVGFGKTEVAIRAAFKAVQDGRQAAVLVPTTLLASQHYQTFSERYAPFPVRVELLSRFLTDAQAATVLAGLADGSVDVVVGTHRLLGSDVRFRRLGLLVVDEEQRFGVAHKEAIKAMTDGVDVLTLTASPIPRTLEMALTGIRDLSMVNTPPAARRPILTYVGDYDEAAVSEAIRRELLREGQVFFVHNRVQDIDAVAERLRRLVPEARVSVAHGQMDEGSLEQVVMDFWEGAADVLVCTTIVESGIDMPTVNTLVVDRADRLGLGQLHQLRGRVGRAGQRAYAYLFHPSDQVLSETATERLRTIGDHTELGSGFKIALRDLQIRGAGNLLGRDQSGHVAAVGYDLYVQMVSEAVAELKGEARPEPVELSLDLPDDAHLPADYVPAEDVRLEAYRRLTSVRTDDEVDDVRAEWEDRFGPLPPPAEALVAVARLRAECVRLGITDVAVTVARGVRAQGRMGTAGAAGAAATVKLSPVTLPASAEVRLRRLAPGATYHADLHRLLAPLPVAGGTAPALVELLRELLPPKVPEGDG